MANHEVPEVLTPFGCSLHTFCHQQHVSIKALQSFRREHPEVPIEDARDIVKSALEKEYIEWLAQL